MRLLLASEPCRRESRGIPLKVQDLKARETQIAAAMRLRVNTLADMDRGPAVAISETTSRLFGSRDTVRHYNRIPASAR